MKKLISILCISTAIMCLSSCGKSENSLVEESNFQSSQNLDSTGENQDVLDKEGEASKDVTLIAYDAIDSVTEYELVKREYSGNEQEKEVLTAFSIKPGQYAVSDKTYDMNEKINSFEYSICWSPMGQYIRIGLLSENKENLYFISSISGKDEGVIDITQVPTGNYFVVVYNETSDNFDLEELNGSLAYCFR